MRPAPALPPARHAPQPAPLRPGRCHRCRARRANRKSRSRDGPAPVRSCQPSLPGKRSEEHTSELQSLMRISYAVFCLKKKKKTKIINTKTKHSLTDNKEIRTITTHRHYATS